MAPGAPDVPGAPGGDDAGQGRRVLRRCPDCRLLFESPEGIAACVVCGATVVGVAQPTAVAPDVFGDSTPTEIVETEPTARLAVRRTPDAR